MATLSPPPVSIGAAGLAPKLPNDAAKFLDGTGAYSTPAGGGTAVPGFVIKEVDGSPLGTAVVVVVPNGSLAFSGGTATLTFSGGTDLSAFRLSSIADDGSFGTFDEMEYADQTALEGVWTVHSTNQDPVMRPSGSSAYVQGTATGGQAMDIDATGFDSEFEIAFLVSGHQHFDGSGNLPNSGMCGIHFLDTNGDGLAMSPYIDGNSYRWVIDNWSYSSTGASVAATALTSWNDGRAVWWAVRKDSQGGGNFKYRLSYSLDGASWTHVGESASIAETPSSLAWVGWGKHLNAGAFTEFVHAVAYGTPDLGI